MSLLRTLARRAGWRKAKHPPSTKAERRNEQRRVVAEVRGPLKPVKRHPRHRFPEDWA